MQPSKSLPWWKRILVDEQFRKQLTFIATEIYRWEQIVLEKYPERITYKESTRKERKACEPSCLSSSSSSSSNQKELEEEEEEFFKSCTSQFLFLHSTDNVATHHPQSIINTSSYKVEHTMLLPSIAPEQNKFTKNNNCYNSNRCNAECEVGNGKYTNESHCWNSNSNINASSVVSNYLHRVRRYSTETSERCKKCDARDIIDNNLEYQEARDALNADSNYSKHDDNYYESIIKNRKSVFYFPSIESVEESMMWARVTQNTPYAKLFAVKSARTQVDERKKEYMASQVNLHNNITNSCNSNNRLEKIHNSKNVYNKNDKAECEHDEMHFRKLLARSCVDGANNLYGLSYYWSTSSSSSHSNQINQFGNSATINGGYKCNLPPAGFIRVNPDPREAMWPDIDNNETSFMNDEHNVEREKMCLSDKSAREYHHPQHKRRWERLKEYVNKRNAKLAMLRAHGCEITMNMLHDNSYTLEDKALQQWMSETKQNRQEMEKSNWYSSHEQEKTINTNTSNSDNNNLEMLNSKKSCLKPFRHNSLFVNFMKPLEHYSNNDSNYNETKTKRRRSNKWQCVGTFRQSQLLILYKMYCVALHKYSTTQQKKKELRSHQQEEQEEEELLDLSDVPFLQETESVYKVSWSSTDSISQKETSSPKEESEHKKHYLLGLLSCALSHVQQQEYNSSINTECEMKWQWWWDYLHNSSLLARQALRDIYNCLPLSSERELGADGYMTFVKSLLHLFFPTFVGNNDLYDKIAHEEWVYRGTAEILIPFNTFFEKFFTFPFIFMRDIAASTEQDYVEFWTLVRICLYGDHSQNHCPYFFTRLPYVNSTHSVNTKIESSLQLQKRKDKSKITSKKEMDGLDWSARFTNPNSNELMMSLLEKEKKNEKNNTSMWKLTRPSLLGTNFNKRRLSLLVPLQHFTLDQLRYLNTYPYEHLAPRHNTNRRKNESNKWQTHKNVNKELYVEEEEEVINDITTLHSCKTHLYDDPLAASFIRSKLFTLQEKDRFNRTLSSTILNSERFITEQKRSNDSSSNTNNNLNTDTSVKMICDINHADVVNQMEYSKENDNVSEKKKEHNVEEYEEREKEKEEEEQNETTSTHLPLIDHLPQASTSSVHPLLRQHRSIRIASAGNSRRRMLREAETRIKLKNLLNHSYMYARRRVNLARKLHNKLLELEVTSSSWNLYKDDFYALPLHSPSNTKEKYEENEAVVKEDNKWNRENVWQQYDTINDDNDNNHNNYNNDDNDSIDELLDYVADIDDEVFDNAQVSLRDRFRIHKKYTKLTM